MKFIACSFIPLVYAGIFMAALVVGDVLGQGLDKLVKHIKGAIQHDDGGH